MTKDLKSDRWSCPSDRNLQLRSKLNAGWSYYTNKKSLKKDPQLTESELIEIQKVLQRSEMLERTERERVIKLVDRLENMKRNSSISSNGSQNRCAICGDYFYILRSYPNQCGSCHKTLCSKCCIDTTCTIDNNINNSSNSSMLSRRNSSASISNQMSAKVYLCGICSEQREFLKKSGAWFLKRYPSYLDNNSLSTTSSSNLNGDLTKSSNEKYNSTSNLSQIERTCFDDNQKPLSFASPMNLRRNVSTSSATFRFWKTKESLQNFLSGNYNNSSNTNGSASQTNNDIDNMSNFSTDIDGQNEFNSNYDSITTRTISSENINIKTPTSPAPSLSSAQNNNNNALNSSNFNPLNSKNDSLNLNPSVTSSSSNNNTNNTNSKSKSNESTPSPNMTTNNKNDANKFNFMNIIPTNKNEEKNNKKQNNLNSDDELLSNSPNMSNYNYYSNIITNLKPNETYNNNKDVNDSQTDDINGLNIINNIKKCSNISVLNNSFKSNFDQFSINNTNNNIMSSNNSLNGLQNSGNNDLELSNSNKSTPFKKSEIRSRSFKKPKLFEWCSTQLSIEKEDGEHKSSIKLAKQSLSNYLSKKKAMNSSYNSNSSLNGKLKQLNLSFHKNKNGNPIDNINDLSYLGSDSIAANSSSAVSSVTSLTTSLNKLNLK